MKKLTLALIFFSFCSAFSQTAWIPLNSGTTTTIKTLFFQNANTGFAVSLSDVSPFSGYILKTTNAGLNWVIKYSSSNSGFAKFQMYGSTGYIQNTAGFLITTDNGETWSQRALPLSIKSISFYNANSGYGFTDNVNSYKTTDGGANWVFVSGPQVYLNTYCASFFDENTGFIAVRKSGGGFSPPEYILKTTNGCVSWAQQTYSGWVSTLEFLGGEFTKFSRDTVYLSGPDSLKKTSNGGTNWTFMGFVNQSPLTKATSVYFNNGSTGYATSKSFSGTPDGILWKTTNAGVNWFQCPYFPAVPLTCIYFVSELTGYIGGYYGAIFKTTNGGVTFANSSSSNIPDNFSLSQNYPNPFNPLTRINYELPITNFVQLKVYDALGNEVETLVNEKQNAGSYSVDFNAALYGSGLPSGIYFYKLVTEKFSETRKMILIK